MILKLDEENANFNLTTEKTVLTHTPDTTNWRLCQAFVKLGDGADDLDGTGGNFQFTIEVGGQTIQPGNLVKTFTTDIRSGIYSDNFAVPPGDAVLVKLLSPNAGDTDVDITAYLLDCQPVAGGSIIKPFVTLYQLEADQQVPLFVADGGGNGLSGLTLANIDIKVWKPGMTGFGNTVNTNPDDEVGDGWYLYPTGDADIDVVGPNIFQAKAATSVYCETMVNIVEYPVEKPQNTHPQLEEFAS